MDLLIFLNFGFHIKTVDMIIRRYTDDGPELILYPKKKKLETDLAIRYLRQFTLMLIVIIHCH